MLGRVPRVLLVDDDQAILRLLEVNFRLEGFETVTASRGEDALAAAAQRRPDAIVLDLMLPGLDGKEVFRRLRGDEALSAVPIVFLTARSIEDDLRSLGASRADELHHEAVRPHRARRDRPGPSRGDRVIEDRLVAWLREGLAAAAPGLGLDGELPAPSCRAPRQKEHGDFATNVALGLAKAAGRPPRDVAQALVDALPAVPFVERVEIAGPGFVNVFLTDEWLHDVLRRIAEEGASYGGRPPTGERIQVEFVSANPTGPLTIGHARNAAIGDAVARLLAFTGDEVEREYYFNDAGRQMDRFGFLGRGPIPRAARARRRRSPMTGTTGTTCASTPRTSWSAEGSELADLPREERFVRMRTEGARARDGRHPRDARPVRGRVRHVRVGGVARATRARSRWRSTGCARPARSSRRRAPSGSARPSSATTRTGR